MGEHMEAFVESCKPEYSEAVSERAKVDPTVVVSEPHLVGAYSLIANSFGVIVDYEH